MEDPIGSHPTRAEQLDILATVVAEQARPGDRILDFGCGTGYVAKLIFDKRADLHLTGVDLKPESLAAAAENFSAFDGQTEWFPGNLETLDDIGIPDGPYRFAMTALTFHDLPDDAKRRVISFAAERLSPDGYFLLYDRLRLTESALFPLQQSIWGRIEREYGRGMRTAENFDAYEADIAPNNRPGRLSDYLAWFAEAGLVAQILHLHGNVALIAGGKAP